MATVNGYRRKYLKWYASYELLAFRTLHKVFRDWGKSIDFTMMNERNYEQVIANSVDIEQLVEAYKKIYGYIGVLHGKRTGRLLIRSLKLFSAGDFENSYINDIIQWVHNEGGRNIEGVAKTYKADINRIIASGLEEGKGIEEITKELKNFINKRTFYRWQAQRIARTETTSASNMGAVKAGNIAGVVMDKIWLSANDPRTRRLPQDTYDHLHMNEVRIRATEKFMVRSKWGVEEMDYPGDTEGSAGNVINCRCAVAMIAARDKDGNLILK